MLIYRSLSYHWRINLAVVAGVATAVAVLAGALVVGDSVRASLRDLVLQRLGRTDHVILSTGFFREQLVAGLQSVGEFNVSFDAACPVIILEGFVTDQTSGRRASRVQIYGIDERFWEFHGRDEAAPGGSLNPQRGPYARQPRVGPERGSRVGSPGGTLISEALAQELGTGPGGSILIRVEMPSAIPTESLHGRKEDVGRTLRLSADEVLAGPDLGEFSLRPRQGAIRAVFVPLSRLQTVLEQKAKVNAVLVSQWDSQDGGKGAAAARQVLEQLVGRVARLEDLGLRVRPLTEQRGLALESDSAVISDALAARARWTAEGLGLTTLPILTYLATSLRAGDREIPYSVVAALDLSALGSPRSEVRGSRSTAQGPDLGPRTPDLGPRSLPPIVLNEWAARDLGVGPGDSVSMEYDVWEQEGRLLTRSARFQVARVVPIDGLAADRDLTPEYPGITDSDRLTDWDPPFPIDLTRVRPTDEDYWRRYRTTPKAFVSLETGQDLWRTRYGSLTSLRILATDNPRVVTLRSVPLAQRLNSYSGSLRIALDPLAMGFSVYDARAQGLAASQGATDFAEYFAYFSGFLVFSALLLAALFFKLGVEQRLQEVGLLQAVGFDHARIRSLFFGEAIVLSLLGSLLGVAGAVGYGAVIMMGLRSWWMDAVGTTALTLHVTPTSLLLGAIGGILAALGCIWWTLRAVSRASTRSLLTGAWLLSLADPPAADKRPAHAGRYGFGPAHAGRYALWCGAAGLALLVAATGEWIGRVFGFFGAGTLLLAASLCYFSYRLRRTRLPPLLGHGWMPVARLGIRNVASRPGRSVLCIALIASATFIIVAVESFKRDDSQVSLDRRSGTGGYPLLIESLLPIVHDLDSSEARDVLNLQVGTDGDLDGVRFSRFRVRPGDDASCLNLYQPRNPRILAPTSAFVQEGRFSFQRSLAETAEEQANPWLLLNRQFADGAIPVITDANSMTYVLHLGLGEDFVLNGAAERPVTLRLVGALADSIFQGELLMSEANFIRLFPAQEGYRFFLVDVTPERLGGVSTLMETRLEDFGVDASATADRLAGFHRVEYTYLSTFQTLGGLGLLLGTLGLGAVLWRNVLERRRELAVLKALGYERQHFFGMVIAENLVLLTGGLGVGTAAALLAIAPAFLDRGGRMPIASLSALLGAVLAAGLFASIAATIAAQRSPTLPALRAE